MSLKLVVIGAGGLVGIRVAERLVQNKTFGTSPTQQLPLTSIVLMDLNDISKQLPMSVTKDSRVRIVTGSLADPTTMEEILSPNEKGGKTYTRVTVIHLAAVLSGNAEDNFDLGMKINLYGTLSVLEVMRKISAQLKQPQIYFFCSTDYVCAFIEKNKVSPVNEESFRLSPVSYGVQKACVELLVSDYTRKGFLDGRVGRLSAVIGRPGFSNSISYPYTGIFTQPMLGKDYDVPLPMDILYPISCIDNNVASILHLSSMVDSREIGHNRVVQIAAISVSLNDIWAATQSVAQELNIPLGKIRQVGSGGGGTTVTEINVCPRVDCEKARRLGCPMDVNLKDIIRQYARRYVLVKAKL